MAIHHPPMSHGCFVKRQVPQFNFYWPETTQKKKVWIVEGSVCCPCLIFIFFLWLIVSECVRLLLNVFMHGQPALRVLRPRCYAALAYQGSTARGSHENSFLSHFILIILFEMSHTTMIRWNVCCRGWAGRPARWQGWPEKGSELKHKGF